MPNPPFPYKLEFIYDDSSPSDSSVFIHMRDNPPIYMVHTNKEDFDILDSSQKDPFITALFNIAGVTEMSLKTYRIWIMKSPVYTWEEVLAPFLAYLSNFYEYVGIAPLPGSGNLDGTGLQLSSASNRRKI